MNFEGNKSMLNCRHCSKEEKHVWEKTIYPESVTKTVLQKAS